mgnify:CR=1 FL=1
MNKTLQSTFLFTRFFFFNFETSVSRNYLFIFNLKYAEIFSLKMKNIHKQNL